MLFSVSDIFRFFFGTVVQILLTDTNAERASPLTVGRAEPGVDTALASSVKHVPGWTLEQTSCVVPVGTLHTGRRIHLAQRD